MIEISLDFFQLTKLNHLCQRRDKPTKHKKTVATHTYLPYCKVILDNPPVKYA